MRPESQSLGTASPFNVKTESLGLANFTPEEVSSLYAQHTAETGQVFEADAVARAWELTRGQPWLVNDIAASTWVSCARTRTTRLFPAIRCMPKSY